MAKTNVLVMGAAGMLGSMVCDVLSREANFAVTATVRNDAEARLLKEHLTDVAWRSLDVAEPSVDTLSEVLEGMDWGMNCIGIIKVYIHDDNADETVRAININALFPHYLAKAAEQTGAKVIQIATDCVYSGAKGSYVESDPHDALDVYGKTKSLGETYSTQMFHLRDSIIGPEVVGHSSLLDWFLGQPKGATVNGYTNHWWNGVTTLHFAKICIGIITANLKLDHVQHVISSDRISKYDMLKVFAKEFGRGDVTVNQSEAATVIDRTLSTEHPDKNAAIWKAAGYNSVPSVPEMVHELAEFKSRIKG